MVHRALLGSIERFFGILIEHYAGAFPLWLAPEQIRVLPITDRQLDYAKGIQSALKAAGYRCEVDTSAEKLGAKIRGGTMMKVPYMVIVGGKDESAGVISVRSRAEGDKGQMKLEDFIASLNAEKEG
jgi:threonyl-tRNA synthetase